MLKARQTEGASGGNIAKHVTKLSEVLPALEKEIEKSSNCVRPITDTSRWSKKRAYTLLVLDNYSEVVLILKRILDALKEVGELQRKRSRREPELQEQEKETLRTRTYDLLSFLRLDMKALYLWTAHITDVFQHSGSKIDLTELKRISLFRHNFLTQIHETPFFKSSLTTKSGTIYNPEKETFEDLYQAFDFRDSTFVGLQTLVRKARNFIPELEKEQNRFERIKILYRQINRITNRQLQRQVQKFVFRVGLPTDSPGVIADALLQALKGFRRS